MNDKLAEKTKVSARNADLSMSARNTRMFDW